MKNIMREAGCRRFRRAVVGGSMMAVVAVGVASCSSNDARSRAADTVAHRIEAVWDSAGVPDEAVSTFQAHTVDRPDGSGCSSLDDGDAWYVKNTSTIQGDMTPPAENPSGVSQDVLLDEVETGLVADGFDVDRFRGTGSATRVLSAVNADDGAFVQIHATGGGSASLDVKVGPCAALQSPIPDGPYVPE